LNYPLKIKVILIRNYLKPSKPRYLIQGDRPDKACQSSGGDELGGAEAKNSTTNPPQNKGGDKAVNKTA